MDCSPDSKPHVVPSEQAGVLEGRDERTHGARPIIRASEDLLLPPAISQATPGRHPDVAQAVPGIPGIKPSPYFNQLQYLWAKTTAAWHLNDVRASRLRDFVRVGRVEFHWGLIGATALMATRQLLLSATWLDQDIPPALERYYSSMHDLLTRDGGTLDRKPWSTYGLPYHHWFFKEAWNHNIATIACNMLYQALTAIHTLNTMYSQGNSLALTRYQGFCMKFDGKMSAISSAIRLDHHLPRGIVLNKTSPLYLSTFTEAPQCAAYVKAGLAYLYHFYSLKLHRDQAYKCNFFLACGPCDCPLNIDSKITKRTRIDGNGCLHTSKSDKKD